MNVLKMTKLKSINRNSVETLFINYLSFEIPFAEEGSV